MPVKAKPKTTSVKKKVVTLVPKTSKNARDTYEDAKQQLVTVRNAEQAATERLKSIDDELRSIEDAVKNINEANRILAAMYGVPQTLISMKSLRGAGFSDNDTPSQIRAKTVSYIYKSKNFTPKNALNSADVASLHRAAKSALLLAEYDPVNLQKAGAETRHLRDRLELQIRTEVKRGSNDAMRNRVQHKGLDPLEAAKRVRDSAKSVSDEIKHIDSLMSTFLDDIVKLRTLQSLQKRGVNIEEVKKQAQLAKDQIADLESQQAELLSKQKIFTKSNVKVTKRHEAWYAKQVAKIHEKFSGDRKKIKAELAKLELASKNRLDIQQGQLGLSGVTDKTRLIAEVEIKLSALKTTIQKLLLQESSFSVNLNNKDFATRERELRNFIQEGKTYKKIRREDPQHKAAQSLRTGSVWEPSVKDALANKSKTATFPSISSNAVAIIHDKRNPIKIPDQNRGIAEHIKSLMSMCLEEGQAWFISNFNDFSKELCVAALIATTNPGDLTGVKKINSVINSVFAESLKSINETKIVARLTANIRILNTKAGNRGVSVGMSPDRIAKETALRVVRVVSAPNSALFNQVRQRVLLAYRQQLHEWVSRNIRFEGGN